MTQKKRNYYKYLVWALFLLAITGGVLGYLQSEDIDEICNTNNNIIKRINGEWQCSETNYAQGWFNNATNPININITAVDTWYNVTGFTIDNAQGVDVLNNSIRINKNGTYRLVGTASWYGGNSGDYQWSLFVDNTETPACAWHRSTSSTAIGDATMSCIINHTSGNLLQIRVQDLGSPAQDVYIDAFNFNIMEIQ